MKRSVLAVAGLAIASSASACASGPTLEARAATVAQMQCPAAGVSQDELRVLRETAVVKVVPITFHAGADVRSEGAVRVGGVKLLVRAPDGVTADEMTRILQCHSARSLLGSVDLPTEVDDPYTLPGAWVDIDVTPENGLYAIKVSADRVSENLTLLHHASLFALVHR